MYSLRFCQKLADAAMPNTMWLSPVAVSTGGGGGEKGAGGGWEAERGDGMKEEFEEEEEEERRIKVPGWSELEMEI